MLALYRAAVATRVRTVSDVVWDTIPNDPAELPCLVVGLTQLAPESELVFDARCDVYVIGRRTQDGEAELELVALADEVFVALGGVRGHDTGTDVEAGQVGVIAVDTVQPTRLEIGGQTYPAYTLTVAASLTDC
jgi:hypothetical protein